VRRDKDAPLDPAAHQRKWFVETPDPHVNFHAAVEKFREIFGIRSSFEKER